VAKDYFKIQGLGGKKILRGEVQINGAKNAVLKAMAAAILFKDEVKILNAPYTEDVKKTVTLLETAGAKVEVSEDAVNHSHVLKINTATLHNTDIDPEIAKSMRASVVMTGPMLSRYGKVSLVQPGGCVIGARPIDQFIEGYKKMGATVEFKDDVSIITAPEGGLRGAEIIFHLQTVGGTETLMMAAVLAKGVTVLKNCAMEPEITSLAEYLTSCGAKIEGIGTTTLTITGVEPLVSAGKPYVTIPDRIEAGSFLLLAALCGDDVKITTCEPKHLEVLISMLMDSGVPLQIGTDFIHVKNNGAVKNSELKTFNVRTHEYPGFATDLQPQVSVFLTQASGESIIFETIFEGRFKYTEDLIKMGANITIMNPREIMVKGGAELKAPEAEELRAHDIRAGFAVVMAALVASGESVINNIYYIDRGYERLEERLCALGAKVERVKGE